MATVVVPLPDAGTPNVDRTVILEGTEYLFSFDWNGRQQLWQLTIAGADQQPFIEGLALITDYDLLSTTVALEKPPGSLILYTSDQEPPTLETIDSAELYYIESI